MRIRQVKPAFWSDKVTARLPKSARLTYIGLWGLADDAGWIESFDAEQAAAELYPWEPVRRRERDLSADVAALLEAGRVVIHDACGCLEIPHLAEHQRIAGRQSFTARDSHRKHDVATRSDGPLPVAPERNGRERERERNGTVGNGSARAARESQATTGDGVAKAKLVAAGLRALS